MKISEKIYDFCEKNALFEPDTTKNLPKFSLLMPPPNVTGSLHMGHALTFTLQDIIARQKRMDGFCVLYQGGFDHAGIATQNIVEREILKTGRTKQDLGREKFLEMAFAQKENSQKNITAQMKNLGISPAWNLMRFTMDSGFSKAVRRAFVTLFNENLIIQKNYMINWCVKDGALSDIEVEHEESHGALYHLRYFLTTGDFITVATTRPETYFGDVAVMMNPRDPRFEKYKNSRVILPFLGREIPIIGDDFVDENFGSGFVKVTPAHDFNDYDVALRHGLPTDEKIFDERGILNSCAREFAGLDRIVARQKIVQKLRDGGFLERVEPYQNKVAKCYRCGEIIEPYVSQQWFVKKEIAQKSIEKIGGINFIPKEWRNNYDAWMRELKDWCISRQLWWGHRLPVWHCADCGEVFASENLIETSCKFCGGAVSQDENVLDTWFSSGLFAIAPLGILGDQDLAPLRDFYPHNLLITGFDILFFWVARMIFMSENLTQILPFQDVYLHPLVRDENGQKMSKSRGNVVDPRQILKKYSADNLRFSLASLSIQGRDLRLSEKKIQDTEAFIIKMQNAMKFLFLCAGDEKFDEIQDLARYKTPLGAYLKSELNDTAAAVRDALKNYRFENAALYLYTFFWGIFCDFGIEICKAQKHSVRELAAVFIEFLKLLNPFMPFVTEEIFAILRGRDLAKNFDLNLAENAPLCVKKFPNDVAKNDEILRNFRALNVFLTAIRRMKTSANPTKIFVAPNFLLDPKTAQNFSEILTKIVKIPVDFAQKIQDLAPKNAVKEPCDFGEIVAEISQKDFAALQNRLQKNLQKTRAEFEKLEKMLKNEKFLESAPEALVAQYRASKNDAKNRLQILENELKNL